MKDIDTYLLGFLKSNDKVVIACSGGPDSMCLLDILVQIKNKIDIKIIVAHVNHNIRDESKTEKIQIENYCKNHNIEFEYLLIENYNQDNFHDYARNIRYQFFQSIINKYQAKYLFTAHHGDDLVETILMRITRGSSIKGYAGFKQVTQYENYSLVRPLITKTKQEIQDYMDEKKLWYAIDKSNFKDVYTRNRYRKYILPKLKDEDKNVHHKFLKFSKKIYDISNFFEKYTNQSYKNVNYDNKLNLNRLKQEDEIIIKSIIAKYLNDFYKDKISVINDNHINNIYELLIKQRPNITLNLPLGFCFIKSYDNAYLEKNAKEEEYNKVIKDKILIDDYSEISILNDSNETNNNIIYLNSCDIKLPLYVRNRHSGDKMTIKNFNGMKKVKEIFIEAKILPKYRNCYPIVVDSLDQIIWIPGLKKSKFDRKNSGKYDIILKYTQRKDV